MARLLARQQEPATFAEVFRALHELAAATAGVLEPAVLARRAVDYARDLLGVDAAVLYTWDPDAAALRWLAHNDPGEPVTGPRVQPGEGAVGLAFATREPVLVEDYSAWDQALPHAIARDVRTVLAVPLLVGERALGVLVVRTHTPHTYPPEQVQLLALLAAQVAPALEAARLYSEAERRRAEAEALAELAREGAAAAAPDAVIGLITQRACQLVGADYAAVALLAPDGEITWRGTWGHHAPLRRVRTLQFAVGRNLTGRALANGGTVIVERLGDDPTIPPDEFAAHRAEGGRTLLGIVLRGREALLGGLHLGWRRDVALTPAQVALAQALASHAATILDNARTRAELAASEEQFRTLFEAVPCGVLVRDAAGVVHHANAAAEQIIGLTLAQMRGHRPEELWEAMREDGSPLPAAERPSVVALRTRRPVRQVTVGIRRPDGEQRWLQTDAVPVCGPDGAPRLVVTSFVDVTARKEAEARVRELVEGLDAIVWEADAATFQFTFVSQHAEALLGYPVARWLEDPQFWVNLVHPDDRAGALRLCQIAVAAGRDHAFDYRAVAADGRVIWLHDVVRVVTDRAGRRQLRGVMVDVTARKQVEQQQAMLAQSEKLRALGQLAGGVAHNLNQALAIIAGYSDLAREGLDEAELDRARLQDTLELVAQAAMDGGEMVARLIRFARSQRGQARELVCLDHLLAEVAQLTAPRWRDAAQMEGRAITVSVHTEGDVALAGDPASLREAFINLVFNAIDALPAGGRVELTAGRNGAEIKVRVTDSGVGMPPDVQTRIFEPFFTTKGERGSGLGLAMVLSIVEQHGGRVAVRSAPDQGTTIQVTLPAVLPAAPRPPRRAPPTPRPLRVLAVDDDPTLAEMIRVMLTPLGAQVVTAASGQDALARLEREPFDLVISDVGMPGMTGWELAAAVRARWPDVRRVLATGWGVAIDPAVARAQGIETVIAKPYRRADLVQLLDARPTAPRQRAARGKSSSAARPAPAPPQLAARR